MTREGRFLFLSVPGLAENRPSVLPHDKLFVVVADGGKKSYEGYVHEVHDTRVKLGFSPKLLSM